MSILLFLEVLDAVLIRMAPVSWPASGHPAGLVRGPQPPALAARAPIPPFQGAFRCWVHPAAFEALYGRSRDLSPCRPPPACAPRLNRADAVVRLVGASDLSVSPSKMDKIPQ